MFQWLNRMAATVPLALIWAYRRAVSPFTPAVCRFEPSCSQYAHQALRRFGLLRGSWLALRRLLRCHPLYRGSLCDPVPQRDGPEDPEKR